MTIKNHEATAYDIAQRAHTDQYYGVLPYITHPVEAADLSRADGCISELISVLYLHDTVEDTSVTLHELHDHSMPDVVIWAVNCMTCNNAGSVEKVKRAKQNPLSHRGKYYDSLANLRRSTGAYDFVRINKYQQNVNSLSEDFPSIERVNQYIEDFGQSVETLLSRIGEINAHIPDTEWLLAVLYQKRIMDLEQVLADKAALQALLYPELELGS